MNYYNSGQQEEELPILEIRVNFHFIAGTNGNFIPLGSSNFSDVNGDRQAIAAVNEANNAVLSNLIHNQIYTEPYQLQWQYIGDSRMRVVIYTEEDEPTDTHNGVWYHNSNADFNNFIANSAPYGDKVINVRVKDLADQADACSMRGATSCNLSPITLNSWYAAVTNPCPLANEGSWNAGRILVHEILHKVNLCHSYKLDNECALDGLNPVPNPEGDIDPFWECGGTGSTDVDDSSSSCGTSDLDSIPCTSWQTGGSWNIMTEGVQKTCLSRCQWTVATRAFWENTYPWTDACDVDEEPLIISENTTWNTLKLIKNQEVIIRPGAELSIESCQVRMPADGVIRVMRGAKLEMSSSTITNLCRGERWGGIYVEGNPGNQPTLNGNQGLSDGGIVALTNSTIAHANRGIATHKYNENWNSTYYGGLVDCNNVSFLGNRKAIAFYRHKAKDNSRIRYCTFTQSNIGNFEAGEGVSVWDCNNIQFIGNNFSRIDYGIVAYNSKIKVLNDNDFNNLNVGIDVYSTHPNASEDVIGNPEAILGNSFSDNGHHVQINSGNGGGFTTIKHNDFVRATLPSILLDGQHILSVYGNSFSEDIYSLISRQAEVGIVAFECNQVNSSVGFFAQGNNDQFLFNANIFETTDADSYIEDYGGNAGSIYLEQGLNTGDADDDVSFSPSNIFNHTNAFAMDIVTLGETASFQYVNPTLSPSEYTPIVLDNYYELNPLNKLAEECEDVSIGRRVGDPPYDDPKLEDTRQRAESARIEAEENMDDELSQMRYRLTNRNKEEVLGWLVKEAVFNQEYERAENYLINETAKHHKKSIYGVKVVSGQYNKAQEYLYTLPQETEEDIEFRNLQEINLEWLNSGIPPGALLENSIVQGEASSGNGNGFYLSPSQNEFLNTVAFSESPNRSTARALLALIKGERYTNPIDSEKYRSYLDELRRNKDFLFEKIAVFPNPANSILYVKSLIASNLFEEVTIEIFDMTGKTVLYQKIEGSFSEVKLNTSQLNSGLFYFQVKKDNDILHQDRIVIIN